MKPLQIAWFLVVAFAIWASVSLFAGVLVSSGPVSVSLPLYPTADTFVASGRPAQNWAMHESLWVGYDQSGGYQVERSLLGFDASSIPAGSMITSATLRLYEAAWTINNPTTTISVHRVLDAWAENWTWTQQASVSVSGPVTSQPVGQGYGWYAWDVTDALQTWANIRDTSNFGLMLKGDESVGQHERAFWSRNCGDSKCGAWPGNRPVLDVVYEPPTPTPTPTATPTATPTVTPTGVWAIWREPNRVILLPPSGRADVVFDYYNALPSASLSAVVAGAAVFQQNGGPQLTTSVEGSGTYTLTLKAKAGAAPGAAFSLSAQVGKFTLLPDLRSGRIARTTYLPIILRNWTPPPPPTPTPTMTLTPTATPTPTHTATSTPSSTATLTPTVMHTRTPTSTPSQTPETPSPEPHKMHVQALDPTNTSGLSGWTASVTITIVGAANQPLDGVLVKGEWEWASLQGVPLPAKECTTGQDGKCATKHDLPNLVSSVTFRIKHLSLEGWTYDENANVVSSVDIPKPTQ